MKPAWRDRSMEEVMRGARCAGACGAWRRRGNPHDLGLESRRLTIADKRRTEFAHPRLDGKLIRCGHARAGNQRCHTPGRCGAEQAPAIQKPVSSGRSRPPGGQSLSVHPPSLPAFCPRDVSVFTVIDRDELGQHPECLGFRQLEGVTADDRAVVAVVSGASGARAMSTGKTSFAERPDRPCLVEDTIEIRASPPENTTMRLPLKADCTTWRLRAPGVKISLPRSA